MLTLAFLVFASAALDAPFAAPSPSPSPWPAAPASATPAGVRHTVLVLPLETSGPAADAWVGEAVSDQLPRSLAVLGLPAVTRAERLQAQSALEIPDVPLSRATSVRVAEALGATRLITGTYALEAGRVTLSLRLLDVDRATLSAPLISSGPVEGILDVIDRLAWDVALAGPTPPPSTRDEFLAGRPRVPFDAFKAYARGLAARDP
jgi:TolB-like protein